jgi:DNA-binding LacI/PurR family transcriptional regulator
VAQLAGVSTATVSAVINENKYVSPELEQRVREAIDQLGYKTNWLARSLKVNETKTIGLVFTNITSPIWPPIVRAAHKVAEQAGFDTFLVATDEDAERERMSLQSLLAKRVDGIVMTPAFSEDYGHIRQASKAVPVVVMERKVPGLECVITNNEDVSYQAVHHLIDHGRQRIGLVTIPILGSNIDERISGYRRALAEHGLYDPGLIREADFVGQIAFDLARDLISGTDVDAIFTTSQSTAMGALRAARDLGKRVPDDLALFGYDDVPWMQVVSSPLSTIRQPAEEIAELATERLLQCLQSNRRCETTHVLESSVIIRHSCGC